MPWLQPSALLERERVAPAIEMPQRANADFVPFIHLLRGVAPLPVVWAHLAGAWPAETTATIWPPFLLLRNLVANPLHLFQDGAHLGVVIFFLISGYIISHIATYQSATQFVLRRILRIGPVLLFSVSSIAVVTAISAYFELPPIAGVSAKSFDDYLLSAFLLDFVVAHKALALPPTWSLVPEAVFYICMAVIIACMKKHAIGSIITLLAVFFCLLAPCKYNVTISYLANLLVYLPIFVIGRICYLRQTQAISERNALIAFAWASTLFFLLYSACLPGQLTGEKETAPTYVLAVIIFYTAMAARVRTVPRVLAFFADISFSLYLLHIPVGWFVMNVLHHWGAPIGLIVIAGLTASIVAAAVSRQVIEKPFQKLGHRVFSVRLKNDPSTYARLH